MTFNILLDTNVWRRLNHDEHQGLKNLLQEKKVSIFLCETALTLESVPKTSRLEFFKNIKDKDFELTSHLEDALENTRNLDIKILRTPRISMPQLNEKSQKKLTWYKGGIDVNKRMDRMGVIHNAFPKSGFSYLKNYLKSLEIPNPWQANFDKIPIEEQKRFSSAIAEWSDGDLVAAAYGYQIDCICTLDNASKAGALSIFTKENKHKIIQDFGITIKDPDALKELLITL
jgi:hypothetical protein